MNPALRRLILRLRNRWDISDLKPRMFEWCPVWEFALDEEGRWLQDECTVRPRPDVKFASADDWQFVRAEYTAADGVHYFGVCQPVPTSDSHGRSYEGIWGLYCMDHTLFSGDEWVQLRAPGETPLRLFEHSTLRYKYKRLGKTAEQLFPMRFGLLVPSDSLHAGGVLEGFTEYVDLGVAKFVR